MVLLVTSSADMANDNIQEHLVHLRSFNKHLHDITWYDENENEEGDDSFTGSILNGF